MLSLVEAITALVIILKAKLVQRLMSLQALIMNNKCLLKIKIKIKKKEKKIETKIIQLIQITR